MASNDPGGYDIPIFKMEEIVNCFQEGILGEDAKTVTIDHLKNPSPAIVCQIFLSILQKLEIDTDHIAQPQFQSSMVVKYPESLNHEYKYIHILSLMNHVLPMAEIEMTDIISVHWKRLRKIVCAFINYFRSHEGNFRTFEKMMEKMNNPTIEIEKTKSVIETKRNKIAELRAQRSENELMLKSKKEEIESTKLINDDLMVKKKDISLKKEAIKSAVKDKTLLKEKRLEELEKLQQEKLKLESLVVGSPHRVQNEQDNLSKQYKIAQQACIEVQDRLREAEKMERQAIELHQLLEDVKKQGNDVIEKRKKEQELEWDIKKMENDLKNSELSLLAVSQEIDSLKQQILNSEQKLSRLILRWKNKQEVQKNTLNQLIREKSIQESQGNAIIKELKIIQDKENKIKEEEKDVIEKHSKILQMLNSKQDQLMMTMDKYHTETMGQVLKFKKERETKLLRN